MFDPFCKHEDVFLSPLDMFDEEFLVAVRAENTFFELSPEIAKNVDDCDAEGCLTLHNAFLKLTPAVLFY